MPTAMVDRAYENVSFGSYAENTLDGAYTMQMYVEIDRERDCYPLINATYTTEERSEPVTSAGPGDKAAADPDLSRIPGQQ